MLIGIHNKLSFVEQIQASNGQISAHVHTRYRAETIVRPSLRNNSAYFELGAPYDLGSTARLLWRDHSKLTHNHVTK